MRPMRLPSVGCSSSMTGAPGDCHFCAHEDVDFISLKWISRPAIFRLAVFVFALDDERCHIVDEIGANPLDVLDDFR